MKFGNATGEFQRLEMTMTPMIDVCFQIIIFFIANMRIILPEGDFGVTMPAAAPGASRAAGAGVAAPAGQKDPALAAELPTIKIHLFADKNGGLAGIQMGQRAIANFEDLRRQICDLCGLDRGPAGAIAGIEVEIDFDYNLKYEFVMRAVTAISGYMADDKQTVVRMIEKIKFGTPKKPR
jgi:biopolymer transport protein ExbD